MTDEIRQNMREFSRIDAVIPFDIRLVPPEEHDNIASMLVTESHLPNLGTPPEIEDAAVAEWFKVLNAKLDAILNALQDQGKLVSVVSQRRINISGGGLSFETETDYPVGSVLEMKMMLPVVPSTTLLIYGEVVDVRKTGDTCHVGVKFIAMGDEVRDEIVKFVFKCQREELRKKKP